MGKGKKIKCLLLILIDIFLINVAYLLSFYIRYEFNVRSEHIDIYINTLPIIIAIYVIALSIFKMYKSMWRIAGIDEVIHGVTACALAGATNFLFMELLPHRVPRVVTMLACLFIIILIIGLRLSYRVLGRLITYVNAFKTDGKENVLIIGAGHYAQILIGEIRGAKASQYNLIGLVDDNKNKINTYLNGFKVLGSINNILEIISKKHVDLVLIAIPSLDVETKKEIINICQEAKIKMKIMPSVGELLNEEVRLNQMRDVDLRDLLGRPEIKLDKDGISEYIKDKVVLVTGGGGSIGSELCRQISKFSPKKLIILDIYENSAYDLQNELTRNMKDLDKDVLIASVRDKNRLEEIFETYKPQVVFHAAAHKHVPLMEFNPQEAIKNNVVGTLNLAECADEYGVERFVLISTDKAVNPTNVMGATKRLCEMIAQALNNKSKTEFVAVRFGNVLGSNGSVIPLFKNQITAGGPITLTDENITRYFMLIPEAAQLVLQAGAYANGGEIFVLDMGKPVRIYDLAENLIKLSGLEPHKDIKIEVTGLRPGEKLYEELLMDEEGLIETKHEKIFIGKPGEFEIETIKTLIGELEEISRTDNKEKLRSKLAEVVPTYKRISK
ncbi:polysaccharide biosynthesis protein [Clostridium gasigenes]|uniref:polysaccharide biosynthesis protein n=1 Tax=Clostridium gasigenes TaxID=94869 RepID=UPI0014386119|nr:nucleoside-diphosphate sugar epimerase/dehydratase [Clostridium gasigenes]NKF08500.1 polysaccharide biosynthesis protein [Clostridium gasigenes]QSW21313.1 polysaccharide biosynthesis protein [Clostridium gasigenes]